MPVSIAIAYPRLPITRPPQIGAFQRFAPTTKEVELHNRHVYHNKDGKYLFDPAEFYEIYEELLEDFFTLTRPYDPLPSPLPVVFERAAEGTPDKPVEQPRTKTVKADIVSESIAVEAKITEAPRPASSHPIYEPGDVLGENEELEIHSIEDNNALCFVLTKSGRKSMSGGKPKMKSIDLTAFV